MDLSLAARGLVHLSRGVFLARAAGAHPRPSPRGPAHARGAGATTPAGGASRSVLFITVDQQRHDALGVTGGRVAHTPNLDALGRTGLVYRRAHVQNVVCMPSRATMLTGQHPLTHGVVANGVPLPADAPSVADVLARAGYRTALLGKAHFDPHLDPLLRFPENRMAAEGSTGPWHGFEHLELATHGPLGGHHYAAWLFDNHPDEIQGFGAVLTGEGGGDTGAPEVRHNPIRRDDYHTDWIADRALAWLRSLGEDEPFFCWVSFPDPHHPFDPPLEEVRRRLDWRDVPLPEGRPKSAAAIRRILAGKPRHWLDWYDGRFTNPEGGPTSFRPAALREEQLREASAMIHVENELIDDACGRLFEWLRASGRDAHTDIFYTSDHGELQGDLGLMFKGPYHVESLLRVPLLWRPAPAAHVAPCEIDEPVGHVDLAPTFCAVAGLDAPSFMEGTRLPASRAERRERVLTTFDSQFANVGMHLRTLYRDGMLCTAYEPSTADRGGRFPLYWRLWARGTSIPRYDGTEGELYDVREDPHAFHNLWSDPSRRRLRDELVADLRAHLPRERSPRLAVAAPT